MSTLFISYSTKDRSAADIVYQKLIEMGYEKPFRDDHPDSGIPAGADWEQELYRKLRLCKGLIVLCSKNWLDSKWCFAELAYAKAMGKEFFPIRMDDTNDVASIIAERQTISLSDQNIWQRLKIGLEDAKLSPHDDFYWDISECPYPGLESFTENHAAVYFGRDAEIQELRETLNRMRAVGQPRLLYVVGASGSGKSSLVRAGLLPRLKTKDTSHWWLFRTFRWNDLRVSGRTWAEQLAVDLADVWPQDDPKKPEWAALRARYTITGTNSAAAASDKFIDDTKNLLVSLKRNNSTPLFILDQFEEVLVSTDGEPTSPFLQFLGGVMSSPRSPWRCVATVRSDFLNAIQTRPELIVWKQHTDVYSLPLMNPERFYEVIRRPAEKVGIAFEPETLVDQIVKDTGDNDALPMLAFTLRELCEQYGEDKRLTYDEYANKLGRLEGCLKRVADDLFAEQLKSVDSKEIQRALQLAFSNHLVRINEQDKFVRRTAVWNEIPPTAQLALAAFVDRRLLTSRRRDETNPQSERVVEVAHEALFRQWDTLKDWLDARRDLLRWRADVERNHSDDGSNWKGLTPRQLAIARDWPLRFGDEMSDREKKWISAASRKALWWRLALVGATFMFGMVAIAAILFALQANHQASIADSRSREADRQTAVSIAHLLVTQIQSRYATSINDKREDELATIMAREAHYIHEQAQGESLAAIDTALRNVLSAPNFLITLDGHSDPVLSRDGRMMASITNEGIAISALFDFRPVVVQMIPCQPQSLAMSSKGSWVAAATGGTKILLCDCLSQSSKPVDLTGHKGRVTSLVFSPDEQFLASGAVDGSVLIWSLKGKPISPRSFFQSAKPIDAVAFNPDGSLLVAGTDKRLLAGNPTSSIAPEFIATSTSDIRSIQFYALMDTLITSSGSGSSQYWSLDTFAYVEPEFWSEHTFYPSLDDGFAWGHRKLAVLSRTRDCYLDIWELAENGFTKKQRSLLSSDVHSVVFGPQDRFLVTSHKRDNGTGRKLRFWLTQPPLKYLNYRSEDEFDQRMSSQFGVASKSGGLFGEMQYRMDRKQPVVIHSKKSNSIIATVIASEPSLVAFNQSETDCAIVDGEKILIHQVVSNTDGERIELRKGGFNIQGAQSIAFTPMKNELLVSTLYALFRCDIENGTAPKEVFKISKALLGRDPYPAASEVSRDGSLLAFAINASTEGQHGKIYIWKIDDLSKEPLVLERTGTADAFDLSFDSKCEKLVGGFRDKTVCVWDLRRIGPPISFEAPQQVRQVAFTGDGKWVIGRLHQGGIEKWPLTEELARFAEKCTIKTHLRRDEWSVFVGPGFPYEKSLSSTLGFEDDTPH